MSGDSNITILGETINVSNDYRDIYSIKFLEENPRVYACTREVPGFDEQTDDEKQEIIYQKLRDEPSVQKLIPDIKRHKGLLERILIRADTNRVIEGNSRLAAYRYLYDKYPEQDDLWCFIPCDMVSSLEDEQQTAFLNQIHVKGKTQWSAYEKANFAYVRRVKSGWDWKKIAKVFGESKQTLMKRVKVIKMMVDEGCNDRSRFSYYNVLVSNPEIAKGLKEKKGLREKLIRSIASTSKQGGEKPDADFTALEMRKQIPAILKKPKVLKKYIAGQIDMDEAYQTARVSNVEEKVKRADEHLKDIDRRDIEQLEQRSLSALKQAVRKLSRVVKRIEDMVNS